MQCRAHKCIEIIFDIRIKKINEENKLHSKRQISVCASLKRTSERSIETFLSALEFCLTENSDNVRET